MNPTNPAVYFSGKPGYCPHLGSLRTAAGFFIQWQRE